jgi:hypothetical protein
MEHHKLSINFLLDTQNEPPKINYFPEAREIKTKVIETTYHKWTKPKLTEQNRELCLALWMEQLRNKTFEDIDSNESLSIFQCSFGTCNRTIKGRGNLR